MRMIASLAAAAALAIGFAVGPVVADDDDDDNNNRSSGTIQRPAGTLFDLGIDVTPVPATPAAVGAYLNSLPAVTRNVLISTCEHYMATPGSVRARATLNFCAAALDG